MAGESQAEIIHLNRTIGAIENAVTSLEKSVRSQQESSEQGRSKIYEKIEDLSDEMNGQWRVIAGTLAGLTTRVDNVASQVNTLDSRVAAAETIVNGVAREKLIKQGAREARSHTWSWLLWLGTIGGYFIHEVVTYLKGHA